LKIGCTEEKCENDWFMNYVQIYLIFLVTKQNGYKNDLIFQPSAYVSSVIEKYVANLENLMENPTQPTL
jgi:hypothetical protein